MKNPRDVLPRYAEDDRDVDTLMTDIVCNSQALEPSAIDQAVADKIHAP